MKIYNPNNFIKDQILPSQYRNDTLYYKNGNNYINISNKELYVQDANDNYVQIGRLSNQYNAVWFASDMDFLNRKLNKTYHQQSIWDFYKISDVVTESSQFAAKSNSLVELTGLIINCNSFIFNDDSYNRGDIVYREADGQLVHIPAERGGMFYPSKITKDAHNNNFTFTYSFINTAPSDDTPANIDKDIHNVWDASNASTNKQINFQNIEPSESTLIYSEAIVTPNNVATSITFDAYKKDEVLVQPIIKMYILTNNGNYEEIYVDFSCTYSEAHEQFTLTIPAIVDLTIVK